MLPRPAIILLTLLFASPALSSVQHETIEYELGGITFKGQMSWDDSKPGKRPGVLVVHEWWGCNDYAKRRADEMAALGYVAFACDMYGSGKNTSDPKEAGAWAGAAASDPDALRTRATAALQQLSGFRLCDGENLGAFGFCFGGKVVLELARSGADLDAVACFHGGLATKSPAGPGAIRAEVLVLNGAEDPMVSTSERQAFMDEMRAAKARWTFVDIGGAVHAFTNPDANALNNPAVRYDGRAEKQAWSAMNELFGRTLKKA